MPIATNHKLAPNFTFGELTSTNHRSLLAQNRAEAESRIEPLTEVARMLQVIRDHYGRAVRVNSGYRCPALNTKIGGSRTSQHMKGEAADFTVDGVPLEEVFDWIRLESGIPFGQLICEGVVAGQPTWIHISLGEPWRPAERCGEAMTWDATRGYVRVT